MFRRGGRLVERLFLLGNIWWHITVGNVIDGDIRKRLKEYDTNELKVVARQIAKMQNPLDQFLTGLGLVQPPKPFWAGKVLPALQREINQRENPTPRTQWNKPELLATIEKAGITLTNGRGLCPFHEEQTPSFRVDAERQRWRCWGACGIGGDSIDFLRNLRRMKSGG